MRASTLLLFVTAPLAAQQASPYVPLQHWAMPYVEHLIAAGVIADPTPLTRPFKRSELVRALEAADTTTAGAAGRAMVRRLHDEFATQEQKPHYWAEASIGLAAANYTRRDPLRADTSKRAFLNGGLEFHGTFGPVIFVTHPTFDTRLRYDPDWAAYDPDHPIRFSEAYLNAQWRYGELFLGALDRNWGPSGIQGILLSDNPYTLAGLEMTVGTPRIQLQGFATQLDTRADSTGALVNRYFVGHRLWMRPKGPWTLVAWEVSVLSGVGRQLEPWYLDIAQLGIVEQATTGTNVNSFLGIDFQHQGATTFFGQFMLDDIQVNRSAPSDEKPASYALTVGAKGRVPGNRAASWLAYYTQVANLTYRNEDNLQVPLYHLLGTGRNYADYDQATAKLSVLARPGLLLEPEVTLLRQGEGDPRLPHPPVSAYTTTATLFQGVVQRTVRFALGGSFQHGGWSITGNGGVHLIHNTGHVTGVNATRWVGRVGITYRFHREGAL